ncbi:T-cell receptor alpha chain V region 2B4 [Podarcis lilfordi]|nr:T-cell receptor alpha chain V region 2B4 [Podarcis lilfordi]
MASAPTQCYQESTKLLFLIALWCALLSGGATVKVTQEPPFASSSQGGRQEFKCSLSGSSSNYHFFWYHQLPGKKELQPIGTLYYHGDQLQEISDHNPKDWLNGKWLEKGKNMSLVLQGLQPSDTGLYLCAVRDTVRQTGTAAAAKLSASVKQPQLLPCAAGTCPISCTYSITSHN